MEYYDTHCHPHDHPGECGDMGELKIAQMALMGVHPENWRDMLNVHSKSPHNTLLGFGVHPWHTYHVLHHTTDEGSEQDAEETKEAWYISLREYLEAYPSSFVGEIGLDRKAKSQRE